MPDSKILKREATLLIWLDLRCTDSKILSKLCPQGEATHLIWLDLRCTDSKILVNCALKGGHPFYLVSLRCTDSKILSKLCPQGKTPSYLVRFKMH